MRTIIKINVSLITLVALAACDQGTGSGAPLIPGPKEEACLSAVASATGVSELVLLDAADTRSGRNVIVGVGPNRFSIPVSRMTMGRHLSRLDGFHMASYSKDADTVWCKVIRPAA